MLCWSLAHNSLWGVSGRIGLTRAHLTEATVGAVFAVALGAGLLGVTGAGALGPRLGRALPIGAGTVVLSYVIGLAADQERAAVGKAAEAVESAAVLEPAGIPLDTAEAAQAVPDRLTAAT